MLNEILSPRFDHSPLQNIIPCIWLLNGMVNFVILHFEESNANLFVLEYVQYIHIYKHIHALSYREPRQFNINKNYSTEDNIYQNNVEKQNEIYKNTYMISCYICFISFHILSLNSVANERGCSDKSFFSPKRKESSDILLNIVINYIN